MQIDRIGRDKSYEMVGSYGLKIWDKVSVSGTVSPGEDLQNAYNELDKILEEAHQQTISELDEFRGTKVVDVKEDTQQYSTIEAINNTKTIEELKGYWLISKGNLTFSEAYKAKEKQLLNGS